MNVRESLTIPALMLAISLQSFAQTPGLWRVYRNSDGLADTPCTSVTLSAAGNVILGHPKTQAVTILDGYSARVIQAPATKGGVFESSGGQLWAPVSEGLAEYREGQWTAHSIPQIRTHLSTTPASELQIIPVLHGRILVLLPDSLLRIDVEDVGSHHVMILRAAQDTSLGNFITMTPAKDGGLWVSGSRGIARLAGPLRSVTTDSEWAELIPPSDMSLRDFSDVTECVPSSTACLATTEDGNKALAVFDGRSWTLRPIKLRDVRHAWQCGDGVCAVTDDTLYHIQENGDIRAIEEMPARRIFDVAVEKNGSVWLATSDGVYRRSHAIWSSPGPGDLVPAALATNTAGHRTIDFEALFGTNRTPTVVQGLPPRHVSESAIAALTWNTVLFARNGDAWLGGNHQVAWRHQDGWELFVSTNQLGPENVLSFAESPEGRIWCATPGRVWEFDGRDWLIARSGLDNINTIACTSDGTLWVAAKEGVHRLVRGAWLFNADMDGLPSSDVRSILEDERGVIWASTAKGPCRFSPQFDTDPPKTILQLKGDARQEYQEGDMVSFTFQGRDKWNVTAADRLLFSYRLDEREWTPFDSISGFSTTDLPLGKHYFQVRGMDRNANIDPRPARFEFVVVAPWYRETRLVLVLSVALAISVFFAAIAVNRHRKLLLSYAQVEAKIAERTRELELASQELLHSQKMNALGTLSAGIAHDFNNILSIIKGSAQIIEDNIGNPEKIRTRVDRIKTVVQQGAGIVEAMLGFSRTSEQQAGPADLRTMVDDTIRLLGDRFLREVEVQVNHVPDAIQVTVQRDFVQQVLLNFIFNAAEAMTGRKRIVISTQILQNPPPGIVLSPPSTQACAAISVRDFGTGISPENLPRIFEPFFTTKAMSARRGTGLGLSMAYELARKMGAGLAVETQPGSGSTFTLILPLNRS